jgi:biotin transport system ATP-binding protein
MIEVKGLSFSYADGTPALKDVNFAVADGEFLLLCGANGSGKTTLIRHLNGLLKPSSGAVLIDGLEAAHFPREAMQRVGMVFQDADSQMVGETVGEDVAFGPENLGLPSHEVNRRVASALQAVGLEFLKDKPCHRLSGGEKRRVAIAGVLAMECRVLVFDEPFANLDFDGVRQVLEQLVKLHVSGHTLIVASHDVEKVIPYVHRVAVMFNGELKVLAPPGEVLPLLSRYGIRPPSCSLLGEPALSWLSN